MGKGFKGASRAAADWVMRYTPDREYFLIAHVYFVVFVSVAAYQAAAELSKSALMTNLFFYSPLIAAALPITLLCTPMYDEKKWKRRAVICAISVGLGLVVACIAHILWALYTVRPFY